MIRPLLIATLAMVVLGDSQSPRAVVGVTVWTTSGVPVYDIDCRRFELRVGQAIRPIAHCSAGPPLTVALLFDASGSFPYDLSIKAIVEEVASRLREDDRLSVGWFGGDTHLPDDYTRDASRLKTAADRADRAVKAAKGPSPLWDAVVATLPKLTARPGRKALITFTDGWATGNRTAFGLSALEIVRSGVEIHAVGARVPGAYNFEPFVDPELRARQLRLWTLARASGGTASLPGATFQYLKPTLRTILDELQRGILLEFESLPTDTGVQPLSVRITTPGFIVRAPDRYAAR